MRTSFLRRLLSVVIGSLTCTAAAFTLPPTGDTSGTKTYGGTPPVVTKTSLVTTSGSASSLPVSKTRTAFIEFDVAGTGLTATAIDKARLTLYLPTVTKAGNLSLHLVTQAWDENFTGLARTMPSIAPPFATIPAAYVLKKQFVIVDVTQQVKDWLTTPASNYGFAVSSLDGIAVVYLGAKEGPGTGYPAMLEIDVVSPILDTSVTTPKIADASITSPLLAPNLTLGGLTTGSFIGTFSGNGAGLTGLLAGSITGTLTSGQLAADLNLGGTTSGTFNGTFIGSGAGLTGLPTSSLSGAITSAQLASGLTLGGITTGSFNGPLVGNVNGSATSFTGALAGDVTGTQSATVVSMVGGSSASVVATGASLAIAATNASTAGAIVKRDGSGNFSAGTITANGFVGDGSRLANIQPSAIATLAPGMAFIPAGPFTMGNSVAADTDITNADPITTTVSAFYMDVNEVTLSQWQSVYYWAMSNGYSFGAGAGKGPNHPVHTVSWYDVVKWCNARSEQAGKVPVYYTDDAQTTIYKTGTVNITNAQVKWSANGYRLPTEAEWEKAARGGMNGQRFPWGNTITQNLANYTGNTSTAYDLGPNGLNATGSIGGTSPATTPVGTFARNGYGLSEMAGNVWEWCWDWVGTPYAGGTDPHGIDSAPPNGRVIRGGSWLYGAARLRCAERTGNSPSNADYNVGFRTVLAVTP